MISRHEKPMPLTVMTSWVRPISQTNMLSSRMRKTSASASPICRARLACTGGIRETMTDRKKTLWCPARFRAASRSAAPPMLPGWSVIRSCVERPCEPDRGIAADDIDGDGAEADRNGCSDVEVLYQRDHRQHRPDADQGQCKCAQAQDADRMNHVEGNKRERNQSGNHQAQKPRRPMQQEQIKCRGIPQ